MPASIANAAPERQRPGCDQDTSSCAAATGPIPNSAGSSGIHAEVSAVSWVLFAAKNVSSIRTTPASCPRVAVSTASLVCSAASSPAE